MSCPKCAGGLPLTVLRCPECGTPNSRLEEEEAGQTMVFGATRVPSQAEPSTDVVEPGPLPVEPPFGLVTLYAESSEPPGVADAPPVLGRVFALRKGEVFFAGKVAPTEVLRADGTKTAPIAMHLFPFSEGYAHISRRHMTLEFTSRSEAILFDLSTNGVTLLRAGTYAKNGRDEKSKKHVLAGGESVVLGIDATRAADAAARDRASRYRIDVLFPWSGAKGAA